MTLKKLGEEYLKQAEIISGKIEKESEKLKHVDESERMELKKRIRILYEMKYDCIKTGERLVHYYDTAGDGR